MERKNILTLIGALISVVFCVALMIFLIFNTIKEHQKGFLEIKSSPPGANVYINGEKIKEITPCTIKLAQRYYDIKIEKEGYFPFEKIIKINTKQKEIIEIELESFEENPQKYQEFQEQSREIEEYQKSEEEYRRKIEKLHQEQPLTRYLPYGESNFSIDYLMDEGFYVIEIPFNYRTEKEEYIKAMKSANKWIKSKGIDPRDLHIKIKDRTPPADWLNEPQPG